MKNKFRFILILVIVIVSLVGTAFATAIISYTVSVSKQGKFKADNIIYSDDYISLTYDEFDYSYYGYVNNSLEKEEQGKLSINIVFNESIKTNIGTNFRFEYDLKSNNAFYNDYIDSIKLDDEVLADDYCVINANDGLTHVLDFYFNNKSESLSLDEFYLLLRNTTFNLTLNVKETEDSSKWFISSKTNISTTDKTLDYLYKFLNNSESTYQVTSINTIGNPDSITLSELNNSTYFDVEIKKGSTTVSNITSAGNYTVKVTNDKSQNITASHTVLQRDINECILPTIDSYVYTGSGITPTVELKYAYDENNEYTLVQDTDYTVAYQNNINAGSASIIISGIGNFTNTVTITFTIEKATYNVEFPIDLVGYTGTTLGDIVVPTNEYGVFAFENPETEITTNGINVCHMIFTPNDIDNYEVEEADILVKIYTLIETPEEDTTVYTYNGKDQTYIIEDGEGYSISSENLTKKNAVTYIITIQLDDYYLWSDYSNIDLEFEFIINKKDLTISGNDVETDFMTFYVVSSPESYTVIGLENVDTLSDIVGVINCTSTYKIGSNVGTYNIVITTEKSTNTNYNIIVTSGHVIVTPASLNNFELSILENSFVYTGQEVCATPVLTNNGFTLQDNHYDIEYVNNINAGTATVRVTGKGNYKDTVEANYTILKANCEFSINMVYPRNSYYLTSDTLQIEVNSNATGTLTVGGTNYNVVLGTNNITINDSLVVGNNTLNYTFTSSDSNINNYTTTNSINYVVYATVEFVYEQNSQIVYVEPNTSVSAIEPFDVVGYEFDNWYVNNAVYNFNSLVTTDLTIIGRYNIITYTVTYVLNSGLIDGESNYSETYTINNLPYSITTKIPSRDNYIFDGWFDTDSFDNQYTGTIISQASDLHSFNVYAKWTYDGTITIDHVVQTNTEVTYNASNQYTNLVVYSDATTVIDSSRYTVIYMLDGVETTPKQAGTYTLKLRFQNGVNINDVDINNTFVINQKSLTISITSVPDKVYDGTTTFNDYSNLVYSITGIISGDSVDASFSNGTYNNKNCGTRILTLTVTLSGTSASNYSCSSTVTATGLIVKKQVSITGNLTLATAVSINYSSPMEFSTFKSSITVTFDSTISSDEYSIVSMYDNTFMYGTIVTGIPYKYTSSNYRYVAGSTYIAIVEVGDNYELVGANQIYIKYKTAKVGSTFYTIEDAIASSGTTAITFAGNPTTTEEDIQITTFSMILSNASYTNSNHPIVISYESFGTGTAIKKTSASTPTSTNTVCVWYIPSGITLTCQKDVVCNGELAGVADTGVHGVVMNDGILNITSNLNCYGYIKGNGMINAQSGSAVIDTLKYYDYPGSATTAYNLSSSAFPMYEWILNNISCSLKIYNGATLSASTCVWGTSVGFNQASGLLIGKSSDNNCLFKPTSSNSSHYVLKKTVDLSTNVWNTKFTSNNQSKGISLSEIEVYGTYQDSTLSISVYVTFKTSTSIPLPLSYTNIHVLSGSTLTISKSSFIFMNGTNLTVDTGATVTVNGSSFVVFDKYQSSKSVICTNFTAAKMILKQSAKFVLNGTLNGTGYVGGTIETTTQGAVINFSNRYISENKIAYKSSNSASAKYGLDYYIYLIAYNSSTGKFDTEPSAALTTSYTSSLISGTYGWLESSSTLSYETNCDLDVNDKTISMSGSGYTLSSSDLPNLNRNYYTFNGWFIDQACTINALNHVIYSSTSLYAKWTPITYNINYVDKYYEDFSSGNTSTNTNQVTFNYETDVVLDDPINGEYVFGGWYLNTSYTNKINMLDGSVLVNYLSSNSVTIYVLWYNVGAQKYVIHYENSNTAIMCPESDTLVGSNYNWSSYNLPVMTDNDNNYNIDIYFGGWYNGSSLVTSINANMFTYNDSIDTYELTLVASWISKNSLEIVVQGLGTIMTVYYVPGFTFTVPSLESKGIYLGQDNMVLINWIFNDNTTCNSGDTVTLANQNVLAANIKQFVQFKIGTNSYTTVTVTLTSGQGYTVEYDQSTKISTATAFNGTTKTNGDTFYVTVGSQFAAKYSYSGNNNDGKATISGTSPTSNLTTSNSTYTVVSAVTITPSGTKSCLLPNTLVAMADGTFKEIQYIQAGEMVIVFNHETGMLDIAPVTFNEYEEEQWFSVIHLVFDNGSNIGVISEHGFFDLDTMRYEYIDESNYMDFIGHRFYTMDGTYTILVDAYVENEFTMCYSLPSYYHLNLFTDDILSMPGGITGLFNIFEYAANLQYDQEKMIEDINTYGLFTIEEFEPYGVTEEMFYAYAGQYLKVALGKGILTEEYLYYLIERYGGYTE